MDHSLRTISYIADIGDILVIMARRRLLSSPGEESLRKKKQAKILCHVFESEEVSFREHSFSSSSSISEEAVSRKFKVLILWDFFGKGN